MENQFSEKRIIFLICGSQTIENHCANLQEIP